jgi:hypothetical protein
MRKKSKRQWIQTPMRKMPLLKMRTPTRRMTQNLMTTRMMKPLPQFPPQMAHQTQLACPHHRSLHRRLTDPLTQDFSSTRMTSVPRPKMPPCLTATHPPFPHWRRVMLALMKIWIRIRFSPQSYHHHQVSPHCCHSPSTTPRSTPSRLCRHPQQPHRQPHLPPNGRHSHCSTLHQDSHHCLHPSRTSPSHHQSHHRHHRSHPYAVPHH